MGLKQSWFHHLSLKKTHNESFYMYKKNSKTQGLSKNILNDEVIELSKHDLR